MKYTFMALLLALVQAVAFADTTPVPPASVTAPADPSEDIDAIIKKFKDARDVAESNAYLAGSEADQYLGQNWTDYQQAIRKQELYKEQVRVLDEKIAELEKQKAKK
ncbi:MAG: hypothetical protein LLF94_00670 [Chlamydiales bacterium]|nr:hypothetical protein [Chlamydiales bacterium]